MPLFRRRTEQLQPWQRIGRQLADQRAAGDIRPAPTAPAAATPSASASPTRTEGVSEPRARLTISGRYIYLEALDETPKIPLQPKLAIELVPKPLWGQSIAQCYKARWDELRRPCYRAAGYRCEICGGKGSEHPVEAHEVWEYTDNGTTGVQRLVRLIALCPLCHQCKHMGRSGVVLPEAEFHRVLDHFARVNGWPPRGQVTQDLFNAHYDATGEEWLRRNELSWTQDLSAFLAA
jgi:hypothetical protein